MRPVVVGPFSGVVMSDPIIVDQHAREFNVGYEVTLSDGAVLTYSVQRSLDDPFAEYETDYNTDASWKDTTLSEFTETAATRVTLPIRAMRLSITAHTSGTAKLTVIQSMP